MTLSQLCRDPCAEPMCFLGERTIYSCDRFISKKTLLRAGNFRLDTVAICFSCTSPISGCESYSRIKKLKVPLSPRATWFPFPHYKSWSETISTDLTVGCSRRLVEWLALSLLITCHLHFRCINELVALLKCSFSQAPPLIQRLCLLV